MVKLKKPEHTYMTVSNRVPVDTIYWNDRFELIDIHVNGRPFHGHIEKQIDIIFSFNSKPVPRRTWWEKLRGVGPSYWSCFCVGKEGRYVLFVDLNIDRFEYVSNCAVLIVNSSDMRDELGKLVRHSLSYQAYAQQQITSVVNSVTFFKHSELRESGGGPRKRKPQMTLQSYFDAMPEHQQVFN